jgi:ABC-type cobalamin/Fe3+-siderophores transport system ATPase subunit
MRTYHIPVKIPDIGGAPIPPPISVYQIDAGEVVFIAGPNGVGKSSLIHVIGRAFGQDAEIFSGHRQIHFASDDTEQIGMSLQQLHTQLSQHNAHASRFRSSWGEQHLKSVVRRILNKQNQDNDDIVTSIIETGRSPIAVGQERPRVITIINRIFSDSDLAIEISLHDGTLRASRDGAGYYGIDRLSDGERAALLVVGAILVRPPKSVIAIDEPEKHLNPLISSALIARAIRARPDLSYIIASHDLNLIEATNPKEIIYVRRSDVIASDAQNEHRTFDVEVLPGASDVPEDVRRSVLGARKPLLFVEGNHNSDYALYKVVFDSFSLVPKGGWEAVTQSVKALENSTSYHWVKPHGLIDRDGRDASEISALQAEGIYSLPVPTVENIYIHPAVIRIMAERIFAMYGGKSPKERVSDADQAARSALKKAKSEIVSRVVVWKANRYLSSKKTSVKSIKAGQKLISSLDLEPIRKDSSLEFDELLEDIRFLRPAYRLPVKNTGVPNDVAKALGYPNFDVFRTAVITAVESRTADGLRLSRVLRDALPKIG